jgi:CRP/FNR family cyclic AMP-dependent transcriptional regulator
LRREIWRNYHQRQLGELMVHPTYARNGTPPAAIARDLSGISLFRGLDVNLPVRLAAETTAFKVQAGEIVVEQGDHSTDVYFVLSGGLIGVLLSEAGKEITFTDINAGSYFGELSALDGRPRSLTIAAATPSLLARVSAVSFQSWLEHVPGIARNLAIDLADRNRVLTERIYGLVVHDVRDRVRLLLSGVARSRGQLFHDGILFPAPTHEAIAAHVGANREAVSRVIARLSREGVIAASRQKIVVRNITALTDGL